MSAVADCVGDPNGILLPCNLIQASLHLRERFPFSKDVAMVSEPVEIAYCTARLWVHPFQALGNA